MDIQTIRAFLHAHDPSTVWDVLAWLDEQNCARLGEWDDAYEYFRGALTPDMRAAAIETIMAECWAETERVRWTWIKTGGERVDAYGVVSFKSHHQAPRYYWAEIRPDCPERSYSKSVIISDAHTLTALPIAIKRDLGDALGAEVERRVRERAEKDIDEGERGCLAADLFIDAVMVQLRLSENYRLGRDRRRTIESRIDAFAVAACPSLLGCQEAQAAQADFQRWASDQYARLCVGFLLGPARTR